jgi:hypothetical protein
MGVRRNCEVDPGSEEIVGELRGADFHIETTHTLNEDCVASWTLDVPNQLGVDVSVVVGDVDIRGLRGGAEVESSTGRIDVGVSGGPVRASAGSGSVLLRYEGNDFGAVSARTQVGTVRLTLSGRSVSHQKPPGAGDGVALDGPPSNAVDVRTNVGDVVLELGTP